jgi:flagellar protein FliO/FliZ
VWGAIGVALSVITLAAPAAADPPAAPAPSDVGTPLSLRPSKVLELAKEPERTSTGWKLAAVLALAGGAAFYWRKRGRMASAPAGELTIVRRASVGMRSELLVVNVEGQRLLIGVTPQSIQSLAILDHDEPAAESAPADLTVGARVDALLGAAEDRHPRAPARMNGVTVPADGADLGQARGLLALRRLG